MDDETFGYIDFNSAIDELSGNRKPGRPAYNGIDVNRFYGDVWLLDQLAVRLGIHKDLMTVFK